MAKMPLELVDSSRDHLLGYVARQLSQFFPDGRQGEEVLLERHLDEALVRLSVCINAVRMWTPGSFSYLHSSQYAMFLYFLANTLWRAERDAPLCAKLFGLNKALNGLDLFYEIEMPKVFFIGHSVGIVLAKATYGEYLVLYQNSTVGKNHGRAPVLGEGTIMFPNTAVIGGCGLGPRTTLSQGASLIDRDTPGHCLVFRGTDSLPIIKPAHHQYVEDYFRL